MSEQPATEKAHKRKRDRDEAPKKSKRSKTAAHDNIPNDSVIDLSSVAGRVPEVGKFQKKREKYHKSKANPIAEELVAPAAQAVQRLLRTPAEPVFTAETLGETAPDIDLEATNSTRPPAYYLPTAPAEHKSETSRARKKAKAPRTVEPASTTETPGEAAPDVTLETAKPAPPPVDDVLADPAKLKPKKKRGRKAGNAERASTANTPGVAAHESITEGDAATEAAAVAAPPKPSQRFIVFIGNLPYTATTATVTAHFAKIKPTSVRHLTNPTTGKSKGYGFVEFEQYDRMKTCLKLYHHSSFEDGVSGPRRINVELTAGGGGTKSDGRRKKLKDKNAKLHDERQRRKAEELKEAKKTGKSRGRGTAGPGEETQAEAADADDGDVHPSRRHMLAQQ